MKNKLLVAATVLAASLILVTPVLGITFGELDGDRHPNVGAMLRVLPYPGGEIKFRCSGTLIAPDVFLTAAHCVNNLYLLGYPEDDVYVTFDSVYIDSNTSTIYPGTYHPNLNAWHDSSDPEDIAVIILDEPIYHITPAELPPAGLLDELKADHALKDQSFITVGYGMVRYDKTGGPNLVLWPDGARRFTTGTFQALTKSWLKISMNPAKDDGGPCFGDSGGPHFLGNSNMVVAITSTVEGPACRASAGTYRLDIPSTREYLAQFVDLP